MTIGIEARGLMDTLESQDALPPLWLDRISFEELRIGGYIDESRGGFNNELARQPNNIHPLFSLGQWLDVSEESFNLLMPSLQLATKLLLSPRFLTFWHALLGPRRRIRCENLRLAYGRYCDRLDCEDPPNFQERRLVYARFIDLTRCHKFKFVPRAELVDADATTDMLAEAGFGDLPRTHASQAPNPASIPSPTGWPTTGSITRTAFHLAKTLVHELCHAFNNALIAHSPQVRQPEVQIKIEPFFMEQRRCELGRAWESYVFGGHVDGIGDGLNMQFGMSVTKWPHPFSEEGEARAPSRRAYKTSYAVPMAWVEELWKAEFWNEIDNGDNVDFRIPKILGLRKATSVEWTQENEEWENFSDTDDSELAGLANSERAEAVEKRMRIRIRQHLGLQGVYSDSEDSSVARNGDSNGVIRDGGWRQ